MLGYTKEEAIGKTASALGFIQFTQQEMSEIDAALVESDVWQGEKEFFTKAGNRLFGAVTANAYKGDSGEIDMILFIIKDITKQKQMEFELNRLNEELKEKLEEKTRALFENENRFQELIENSNDIMTLMDESFKLIYRSPAAARVLGWTDEDMVGIEATKNIHPDDKPYAADVVKEITANPEKLVSTKFRMQHKQGNYLWLEGTLINLLQNKNVKAIVFNFRDITTRVESEEKLAEQGELLRLFIEHSPVAIAMYDKEMRYLVASNRWLSDYSLERKHIIGKSHYDIFPELSQDWKDVHQRCLQGATEKNEEELYVKPDGSRTWLRWEVLPWYEAGGAIGGLIIFAEDISQRKAAEEAVIKSEAQYRTLVERVSDGFMSVDTNWNFNIVNKLGEKLLQRQAGDLIGKNMWIEFPRSVNGPFYHAYHQAMKEQEHICIVNFSQTIGSWMLVNIYPSPSGLSIFFKDINKEREAEEKIRKSEELRKTIMASALDAIVCIDADSAIIYWNKQAEKLFGWKEEKVLGKNISETIVPERFHAPHRMGLQKYLRTGQGTMLNRLVETTAVNKEGKEFPIELFIVPVKDQDKVSFYSFIRDISERKKAEEEILRSQARMQQAQEIAQLGNWEIDFKTNQPRWSDEMFKIYGLASTKQFVSEDEWLKLIHPDDRKRVKSIINKGKSGSLGAAYHYRIVRPDATIRHLYAISRYELDEAGNPVGIYGINHDITDRVILEEQLHEQQRKEQLNLTAATLEAQEIERNAIGRELHDNVNQILLGTLITLSTLDLRHEKMEKILELAMKYLQKAVEENRNIAHELVSPDFAGQKLLDGIHDVANTMLVRAGIHVIINASGFDEGALVTGLKLALYRIVQEQCTNIVKHSQAKNVSIFLSNEKQTLKMTITDDGKGMDAQKKNDGIGLRNIKSRLSVYNGIVEMQTSHGEGFALIITIPLS